MVYAHLVGLVNFLVDFLLLLATNQLCGGSRRVWNLLLAAGVGGLYGMLCTLPELSFLGNACWHCVSIMVISMLGFGFDRCVFRPGAIYLLLSMAVGIGASVMEQNGPGTFLTAALIIILLVILIPPKGMIPSCVSVCIRHNGKEANLLALVDTGNTLRDPISGKPVLIVESTVGQTILPLDQKAFCNPIETIASGRVNGIRLIPFSSIGQPSGFLLAIKPELIIVNGQPSDQIVAFAPHPIGRGKPYQALTGGMV